MMQYLDRTLQVKTALLKCPELLEKIRSIFTSHLANDNVHIPIGIGNTRRVYEIGECQLSAEVQVNLLLKLKINQWHMKYSRAAKCSQFSDWSEFGAFEMYYDFIAGHIRTISFRSKAKYERYHQTSILGKDVKYSFSLDEDWGGTKVAQGDMGAVPYFQLGVRYRGWFGQLTEGEPPFFKPKYTAKDFGTIDDNTVENGRIIDIGPTQCLLIDIDRGGSLSLKDRYPNNIGIRLRGKKYFRPENRLDI